MLKWETLETDYSHTGIDARRAKVPGGWLVMFMAYDKGGLTFYPDPNHAWDGSSLP